MASLSAAPGLHTDLYVARDSASPVYLLTLPSIVQHEDGFASGLRITTDYLSATPPFALQSAERVVPNTTSDALLQLVLVVLNAILGLFNTPFALVMGVMVAMVEIVDQWWDVVDGLMGESSAADVEDRKEVLSEVRKMWAHGGGKSGGKKVKFA